MVRPNNLRRLFDEDVGASATPASTASSIELPFRIR
jgi:hypothetical protein